MKKVDKKTAGITDPAYSLQETHSGRWVVTNVNTGACRYFEFKFFAKNYIRIQLNNPPDSIEYYIK